MPNKFVPPQTDTATRTTSTPLDGELLYDTDTKEFYGGDGTTVGGKPLGSTTVKDNVFRIQDNSDTTKQIAFEASGITTATTRTLTVPDNSGTISVAGTLTDKALYYYDDASKLFKPVGIGSTDQVLVAKPSLDPPYQFASNGREVLTTDRTYYVRTDGNDSNDGLSNTAGGAFLTIQKAIDTVAGLDISIYDVTVQLGDGTYSGQVVLKDPVGAGLCYLKGNTATPANVVVSTSTTGGVITTTGYSTNKWVVQDIKITGTSAGFCPSIYSTLNSYVRFNNLDFGANSTVNYNDHLFGIGKLEATGNYTISGSPGRNHAYATSQGFILIRNRQVTITNTPTITTFATAEYNSVVSVSGTTSFTGEIQAGGKKYNAIMNGCIIGIANGFPGSVAGTTATGGQYIVG